MTLLEEADNVPMSAFPLLPCGAAFHPTINSFPLFMLVSLGTTESESFIMLAPLLQNTNLSDNASIRTPLYKEGIMFCRPNIWMDLVEIRSTKYFLIFPPVSWIEFLTSSCVR